MLSYVSSKMLNKLLFKCFRKLTEFSIEIQKVDKVPKRL